jgi:hypothetical protein
MLNEFASIGLVFINKSCVNIKTKKKTQTKQNIYLCVKKKAWNGLHVSIWNGVQTEIISALFSTNDFP